MRYKSALSLVLVHLLLSISACNGSDNSSSSPTPPTASAPTVASALQSGEQQGALPSLNHDNTIAGPDSDHNGVRDDVDAYIDALPDATTQKKALKQTSAAITNSMVVDTANQNALVTAMKKISNATSCTHAKYESSTASQKTAEMEKITVNTKTRFEAYEKFNSSISGMTFVLPEGDGCVN